MRVALIMPIRSERGNTRKPPRNQGGPPSLAYGPECGPVQEGSCTNPRGPKLAGVAHCIVDGMYRLMLVLGACAAVLHAQPKKIVVMNDAGLAKELQSVTRDARVVPATRDTVMQEIPDADGFVGNITP